LPSDVGIANQSSSQALGMTTGVVELVGEPGQRGDSYRALPGQMDSMLRLDHVRTLHALLDRGLASVGDKDQTHSNYALMHDLCDFSVFLETEIPGVIARWQRHQADSATRTTSRPDNDTPSRSGGAT
jgi:hypothetical protein